MEKHCIFVAVNGVLFPLQSLEVTDRLVSAVSPQEQWNSRVLRLHSHRQDATLRHVHDIVSHVAVTRLSAYTNAQNRTVLAITGLILNVKVDWQAPLERCLQQLREQAANAAEIKPA